jgi:hypothetical protein
MQPGRAEASTAAPSACWAAVAARSGTPRSGWTTRSPTVPRCGPAPRRSILLVSRRPGRRGGGEARGESRSRSSGPGGRRRRRNRLRGAPPPQRARRGGTGMTMDTTADGLRPRPLQGHRRRAADDVELRRRRARRALLHADRPLAHVSDLVMATKGPRYALTWQALGADARGDDQAEGRDQRRGRPADGRISKGLTAADRERLARAESVAGVDSPAQPGATRHHLHDAAAGNAPLGHRPHRGGASTDLETEVRGLYVCDASVFPEALARPTVLTILSLARRLADHLRTGATPRGAAAAPSIHHAAES